MRNRRAGQRTLSFGRFRSGVRKIEINLQLTRIKRYIIIEVVLCGLGVVECDVQMPFPEDAYDPWLPKNPWEIVSSSTVVVDNNTID